MYCLRSIVTTALPLSAGFNMMEVFFLEFLRFQEVWVFRVRAEISKGLLVDVNQVDKFFWKGFQVRFPG